MKHVEHFKVTSRMKFIHEGWTVYIAFVSSIYVTVFQFIA